MRQETSRIITEATGITQLNVGGGTEAVVKIVESALALAEVAKPLCCSIQIGACWTNEPTFDPWSTAALRLTTFAHEVAGGNTALLDLRHVPALCATFTGAMAAIGKKRWSILKALVVDTTVRDQYVGPMPLVDAEHFWQPFRNNTDLAQPVAHAAINGSEVLATVQACETNNGTKRFTPVAEWLFVLLRPVFVEQCPDEASYANLFDRTEVFLGVLSQDQALQKAAANATGREWLLHSNWFGRSTWRAGYGRTDPTGDLETELNTVGAAWPPLQAGLFGGDLKRAQAALTAYTAEFKKLVGRRG